MPLYASTHRLPCMCTCQDLCPICVPNVAHPPPLTLPGIVGGGKARNFWEVFHLATWNIPPHMFFGLPKDVAQRWYGTPFHFEHTYIHSYFHTFIYIYIYTYMYLNTQMYMCIYIIYWHKHTYRKMQRWNFWGGVVAKPMYFTVLAGSPPKKIHCQCWRSPFLFPTPAVNKYNGEIFEGG